MAEAVITIRDVDCADESLLSVQAVFNPPVASVAEMTGAQQMANFMVESIRETLSAAGYNVEVELSEFEKK